MKMMQNELESQNWVVFTVAGCALALPIEQVLQVVNYPRSTRELSKMGLVQIGRHIIRCFDLHQQIAGEEPESNDRPFLVVVRDSSGALCAIPVSEPPTIVEVSPEMMQVLPQSDSSSNVLKIASYAATICTEHNSDETAQAEVTAPVFLLDLNRLFVPIAASKPDLESISPLTTKPTEPST